MTKKAIIKATLLNEFVITESSTEAQNLYNQGRYGIPIKENKVRLSLLEALFLLEIGKIVIKEGRKKLKYEDVLKVAQKFEPKFWVRYVVYKDMRQRGYIIKTALKFGADFRVYDRGIKPGEDHAKWVVYPVHEGDTLTWHEFAAKNRVAHTTRKKLMIGVVDNESCVTYYEIGWKRP